jgi:hypothetical protein
MLKLGFPLILGFPNLETLTLLWSATVNIKSWVDREYRKIAPDLVVRDNNGVTVWGIKEKPSKVTTWFFSEYDAYQEMDKMIQRAYSQAYKTTLRKFEAWASRNNIDDTPYTD